MATRKRTRAAAAAAAPTPAAPAGKRPRAAWPASIPFVTFEGGKFEVNPEAVRFLESLASTRLAVVALAGPYRSGKSLLLNRVLLRLPPGEGFPVGGTVNACTKGLHLSTKLLEASNAADGDYATLIVDTEGLGAMTADDTHDARIFSLALLLSSLFMYNSKGTIDQPAINNLSLVANISKHIQTSSDGEETELGDFMPAFMWVIRDFALELVDAGGHEISEAQYLEDALQPVPDAPAEKNRVRESLRRYFKHRGCLTMPRPCDDKAIKTLNSQPESAFSPEFLDKARVLREQLGTLARPKKACGTQITGSLLARLAQAYCAAINKGAAPAIKDSWSLISADECGQAAAAARDVFGRALADTKAEPVGRDGEPVPVPAAKLEQLFTAAFKAAIDAFDAAAIGDRAAEFRDRLKEDLRMQAAAIRARNADKIAKRAEAACAELDERLLEHPTFDALRKRHSELETAFYRAVGADSACQAAWSQISARRVWDWAGRYHAELHVRLATAEVKAAALDKTEAKLEALQARADDAEAAAAATIVGLEQQLRELGESSADWEAQIAELKRELEQQIDDADELGGAHRLQTQQLREELAQAATAASEAEGRADTQQRVAEKLALELDEVRAAAAGGADELARLRAGQQEHLEREQLVFRLEEQKAALETRAAALADKLDRNAEEARVSMEKLFKDSQASLENVQAARDEAKRRCKAAEAAERKLRADTDRDLKAAREQLVDAKKAADRAEQALDKQTKKAKEEVDRGRAELAEVRQELSANAKRFQKQLEEHSTQHRDELRKRSAKAREEQEALFQEKVAATSAVQAAEARAKHAEAELREARTELTAERERAREHNYAARVSELESKLSMVDGRTEMLRGSLAEKNALISEQQTQIIELEDELRQIQQRHEAEKVQMLCDHASKLGAQ